MAQKKNNKELNLKVECIGNPMDVLKNMYKTEQDYFYGTLLDGIRKLKSEEDKKKMISLLFLTICLFC